MTTIKTTKTLGTTTKTGIDTGTGLYSTHRSSMLTNPFTKATVIALLGASIGLSGCQTIKNLTGNKADDAVLTAEKSETGYYQEAVESLEKGRYIVANAALNDLRTFYPTGRYAEQALLDLMYSQFQSKEYTEAALSAERFIKLYPNNAQVDYAYYVRGVANMQASTSALLNFAKQKQAHRDTSYMRLAFNDFQELITRYPNSIYAPDAAQRMSYIYNQLAENELSAARWYIERQAYVAAANRAKWVFQFYPLSEQVPEAIAILAYSNEQLGLNDLAQDYKTLLQINYPEWLGQNGKVRLKGSNAGSWLNKITFGKLGRSNANQANIAVAPYTGATKTQVVQRAAQLQLATDNNTTTSRNNAPAFDTSRNSGIKFGLNLPENDSEQINSQGSTTQAAKNSMVIPDNVPTPRQTTADMSVQPNVAAPNTRPIPQPEANQDTE
ncbi:outer membrane protein assembly factor BamD [Psychrobacter sp. I-STPA10]|uniref:outer membrane protein assembly factor BamD n=1 Tax=Psychrobacter sp. I-STPA10 TaxID=2585769 RepID=UPI002E793B3B|nr:outer membrane protein assembly factor BamD [Psychrobacter sp. I-STPA10]